MGTFCNFAGHQGLWDIDGFRTHTKLLRILQGFHAGRNTLYSVKGLFGLHSSQLGNDGRLKSPFKA